MHELPFQWAPRPEEPSLIGGEKKSTTPVQVRNFRYLLAFLGFPDVGSPSSPLVIRSANITTLEDCGVGQAGPRGAGDDPILFGAQGRALGRDHSVRVTVRVSIRVLIRVSRLGFRLGLGLRLGLRVRAIPSLGGPGLAWFYCIFTCACWSLLPCVV